MARFPVVSGSNLLRRKLTLPADLEGELNILLIPFQQWQQSLIDTWVPFGEQIEQTYPKVSYYELPVIQNLNFLSQTFINEGMRTGIPNRLTRKRTITLYLDKATFRRSLDIPNEDTIYVLVVNRLGDILIRTEGRYSPEKGKYLLEFIESLSGERQHSALLETGA